MSASSIATHLVTFGMIAGGLVVCGSVGGTLAHNKDLKAPLNPFGINTSPFGEVIAMAMQGPVDVYWNNASNTEIHAEKSSAGQPASFRDGIRTFLENMETAAVERTNHRPASLAQEKFLRRQIEDKLRFAYQLDPAHYGNYASYHFFLTEPAVGTRRHRTSDVLALAERTIDYCLSRREDPRHALTAAAAAQNMLLVMFNESRTQGPATYSTVRMRETLALLDRCIALYHELAGEWDKSGNWALLSEQRLLEVQDRFTYILQTREVALKTIERLETGHSSSTSRIANPSSPSF